MDVLVSDRGEILDRHSPTIGQRLTGQRREANPAQFAIETLGFVHFSRSPNGVIHLRLNRGKLSRTCFTKLVWLLTDIEATRVVLQDESASGLIEIFQNFHEIVARLDALRICQDGDQCRPDFQTIHLSLERLSHQKRRVLQKNYHLWLEKRQQIPNSFTEKSRCEPMMDQSFLYERHKSGQILVKNWPKLMKLYHPCHQIGMIGKDISQQPDPVYASKMAQRVSTAIRDQAPVLELVEAVIQSPGMPRRRHRYERLILPWLGQDRRFFATETIMLRSIRAERS